MNVFAVTNGTLKTPPAYAGILRGVTRDRGDRAGARGRPTGSRRCRSTATTSTRRRVFFTGTAAEIVGVTKLDARVIGAGVPGPVTEAALQALSRRSPPAGITPPVASTIDRAWG